MTELDTVLKQNQSIRFSLEQASTETLINMISGQITADKKNKFPVNDSIVILKIAFAKDILEKRGIEIE